jgi:salicylate hydroxylase
LALRIGIVGAGIGGLYAAAALAGDGHEVTILERATAIAEVGAGIQISPNGSKLLDAIGALERLKAKAVEPPAIAFRDGRTGTEFMRMPLGTAARKRWGGAYLNVHRADVIEALRVCSQMRGAAIRLGETVERVTADGVMITASNRFQFDLVIAADGARSVVRGTLFNAPKPQFSGHVAWRGLADATHGDAAQIPDGAVVWQGAGAHVVTYRVSGGATLNIVAVTSGCDWVDEGWSTPGDAHELGRNFEGWFLAPLLRCLSPCWKWGLFETAPPDMWRQGRVVLLGDACHPMVPFLAQGAVQAIEDGATLARLLREKADLDRALNRYGHERHARVARVQQTAKDNAAIFHAGPSARRALMRLAMTGASRVAPAAMMARFDWLFAHDAGAPPFK